MIDLDPDEDLQLVVETARKFAAEELLPRLREMEANRSVDAEVRTRFEETGLAGLEIPESLGGAELGAVARVLVNEEIAAVDPGAALALDPVGPALYPLLYLGGSSALEDLLAHLQSRDTGGRACLILEEDATFEFRGEHVSANIPWVPSTEIDSLVYLTATDAIEIREGIEATPIRGAGLRSAGAAELNLDRAPIHARWTDERAAGRARAHARLATASLLLGVLRNTCDFSRAYALERQAFGRPIAHHQALAFLITDMQMAVDGARLLVHEAAWRVDSDLPCTAEAASAYAQCIEASRFIGPNGVQILGGHGYMADYPMEKTMREARALGLLCGGFDSAIEEAGSALCDAGAPVALGIERRDDSAAAKEVAR
jgi:alkylation response protein AidB-like acyl-CoA dehydrogenase